MNRHFIELINIFFIIGIFSSYLIFYKDDHYIVVAILFITTMIPYIISKKKNYFLFFLCFIFGFLIFFFVNYSLTPSTNLQHTFLGRVTEIDLEKNIIYIKGKNSNLYGKLNNSIPIDEDIIGDIVLVKGESFIPEKNKNPGTFNFNLYLKYKKCPVAMNVDSLKTVRRQVNLMSRIFTLKFNFHKYLKTLLGKRKSSILVAIIYGDKSYLSKDEYNRFQIMGVSHIMAASGMHLAILYMLAVFILGNPRKLKIALLLTLLVVFYTLIVGLTPSILRGSLMIFIHIISKFIHREYSILNALCLSSIVLLALNPFSLFHVGFQFSFIAVYIIARTFHILKFLIPENFVTKYLLPSIIIQLVLIPFTIYVFNCFSILSFACNIILLAFLTPILELGIFLFIAYILNIYFIFDFMLKILLSIGCDFIYTITNILYLNGRLSLDIPSPPIFIILLFYGLFWLFSWEDFLLLLKNKSFNKIFSKAIIFITIITCLTVAMSHGFEDKNLIILDVGQGEAIFFKSPTGTTFLIDGGGNKNFDVYENKLKPALLKLGVSNIDYAITTHLDTDHFLAMSDMSKEGYIKNIITYEGNKLIEKSISMATQINSSNIIYSHKNRVLSFGKDTKLIFLWPRKKTIAQYNEELKISNENSRGLVFVLLCENTAMLVTGDISKEDESQIFSSKKINSYCGIKNKSISYILQVPHHGSKYSSSKSLLNFAPWDFALIPVGKNIYDHPSKDVINKLQNKKIPVFTTEKNGAIGISTKNPNNTLTVVNK